MKLQIDPFIVALIGTVALASAAPARGEFSGALKLAADAGIALLFFLHGAKLSRAAILAGASAYRVHLAVLAATFALFPLLGLAVTAIGHGWLNPAVSAGALFLCLLPSTVQSSIAFTAIARGNVPAAICSASASNLIGVFLTPLLAGLLLAGLQGGFDWRVIQSIALQLLLPFGLGHAARPLLQGFLDRHRALVSRVDRGSILLVVYGAFSAAVAEGLWRRFSPADLGWTIAIDAAILATALGVTTWGARALGFSRQDEIVMVFCGSKKSLVSGVPIAGVLFPPAVLGPMILPLMLFHQMQLLACAALAQRYARSGQVVGGQPAE